MKAAVIQNPPIKKLSPSADGQLTNYFQSNKIKKSSTPTKRSPTKGDLKLDSTCKSTENQSAGEMEAYFDYGDTSTIVQNNGHNSEANSTYNNSACIGK